MNLRTTYILLGLLIVGVIGWLVAGAFQRSAPASPTQDFLAKSLTADALTSIVLIKGDERVELQREGSDWVLPGKWPVRPKEVDTLVQTLAGLRSRFAAIPLTDKTRLEEYGLKSPALSVKVKVKDQEHVLHLGEEVSEDNSFSRPTFLRLDDHKEIVRLGPGLVAAVGKPQEYFQQRRLFPTERVVKDGDKSELLAAKSVQVKTTDGDYTLMKQGEEWVLQSPVKDRVDPDKLKKVLTALPDIWAERFLDKKGKGWDELGFKKEDKGFSADTSVTITKAGGVGALTLLIGKESDVKIRKVPKAPGQPSPFGPPKMDFDIVHEEFRYAKLADNDQLFEIKADKLKDVALPVKELRDPLLARFKSADVTWLDIEQGKEHLTFVKDKDKWRLEQPKAEAAESGPVTKLLDKLADLRVKEDDILDKESPKNVGLEEPSAVVRLKIEEEVGKKTKKTRDIVFKLGVKGKAADAKNDKVKAKDDKTKDDKAKDKVKDKSKDLDDDDKTRLYVQVDDWPRINRFEEDVTKDESLVKLVRRPAYAYKQRRLLDVAVADISTLEIQRDKEAFSLTQEKDKWKLMTAADKDAPLEVEAFKASGLARDLANLEAAEFVTEAPTKEELAKFGLDKPKLTAKVTFTDAKKSPVTTLIVGAAKGDKEFYARLDSGPVFLIKKDLRDDLNRDSLAYLTTDLDLPAKLRQISISKSDPPKDEKKYWDYRLTSDGKEWKLAPPFEAPAVKSEADDLTDELKSLRVEKYVAAAPKDLKEFGLEPPYLIVRLLPEDAKAKEVELHIGKPAPPEKAKDKDDKEKDKDADKDKEKEKDKGTGRYAKLGNKPGVFILSDKIVGLLDHSALHYLDKQLVRVFSADIDKIKSTGAGAFTLVKKKDTWEVADSPAPAFAADKQAAQETLRPWSNLRADKIAAYGPGIDWASFGLDKPEQTLTLTAAAEEDDKAKDDEKDKEKDKDKDKEKVRPKTKEYTLALGKDAGDGQRNARLDKQDQVVVLAAATASALAKTHLDFVDRQLLEFDFDGVKTITRQMTGGDFDLGKPEDSWRFTKPADRAADDPTVGKLLESLFRLRASKIADYPAKKLEPFGLDKPHAVVTLKGADFQGREFTYVIKVGNLVEKTIDKDKGDKDKGEKGEKDKGAAKDPDARYVLVDKKDAVAVVDGAIARLLVAQSLFFADRNVLNFASVNKAIQERPGRKAVFQKDDTTWKLVEPAKADAEDSELEDLVKGLRRLRAEEIVADKDADLKKFGLDKPVVEWRFLFADNEKAHLLVGSIEKDGRRYGKLAKQSEVFLLSAKISERLTDEYRDRKPWPSLDAAGVEKLTVKGPQSFTLEKAGDGWTISTDAAAKVDAKKVTDTLDALSRLKAERYIVDAKADLKLYSLDPPAWTIEAQSATGKRTLLVGNMREGTKQLYATTPGSDAVFLLSEADAVRIARPAAAFVEAAKETK